MEGVWGEAGSLLGGSSNSCLIGENIRLIETPTKMSSRHTFTTPLPCGMYIPVIEDSITLDCAMYQATRHSPPLAATARPSRQQQGVRWSHGLLVMINACFPPRPSAYRDRYTCTPVAASHHCMGRPQADYVHAYGPHGDIDAFMGGCLIGVLGSGGLGYGARLPTASSCSLGEKTSVLIGTK